MKYFKIVLFIFTFFFFIGISFAQTETESTVKKVIEHFFDGLQNGDTITLNQTLAKEAILQTTFINKEGESILKSESISKFLDAVAAKNPEDIWEEKLLSYHIQIDGNMANVWTPYEFYFNKKFSHCGVNSFQLFNNGNRWKIIYLIDTRRRQSCNK